MSFEGFYQILCKNGHLTEMDCYNYDQFRELDDGSKREWLCPICGGTVAHQNIVDQTNCCIGDSCGDEEAKKTCCRVGIGYRRFEVLQEEKFETCEHCGQTKVVSHVRYKIPDKLKD